MVEMIIRSKTMKSYDEIIKKWEKMRGFVKKTCTYLTLTTK